MKSYKKTSRREFLTTTGLATAGLAIGSAGVKASSYRRIHGANHRIRMGFIGVGNRGTQLMHRFMDQPDCEVAALCDVYEPYMTRDRSAVHPRYLEDMPLRIPQMGETFPSTPKQYPDYRNLLDDPSVDAVCISTPDHWHALQTIHSLQAGKDVFVEKPVSMTIHEGRQMVEAERNSNQIAVVGLHRRASYTYQKMARTNPESLAGKITYAHANRISNMYPAGIGKMRAEEPPSNFNWDSWLGPRPYRPYQFNIAPYKFRWWSEYSSQVSNWGDHYMDLIRWLLREQAPVSVSAHGGNYAVNDDRDIPDTMHVTYTFASGAIASLSILEATSHRYFPYGELELRGTRGNLFIGERGYRLLPSSSGQFQQWDRLAEGREFDLEEEELPEGITRDATVNLIRNFLDCIISRNKNTFCTLEEGHRSTTFSLLANIAMATGQTLQWDPVRERITNHPEANRLLHYDYRPPYRL